MNILNILFSCFIVALFSRHCFPGQDSFSGDGGGYLSGEDERGGRGGGGVDPERDGGVRLTEVEGGVHVDGVGQINFVSFSLSVLKFVGVALGDGGGDGGGYLFGEDGRGGCGGADAAAD